MYKQGDILVVPFPFSDLSGVKQRPVLVLSKEEDNNKNDNIITCGITSNLKEASYSIPINNFSLERGTIPSPSRVRVDKLFTMDKSIVRKKVALLNKETFAKVRETFTRLV